MFLKNIKLVGFKSFVDPTNIPVTSRVNAIVGPNGCGKSNVIDAVRWVIGETSAKQLRGQSMNDVIFNGTTDRKPVGKASVELQFDNSSGRIAGEFAGYNEISVKREVTRDGGSNYFLNGTACRRKDIIDIFLGTGLGPRSYSIIEQGMVNRLIEAKPEELRVYLEEASGISKYKERRRETENRMRHTHENLERLEDLLSEVEKQHNHLQRQAEAAAKYKELRAQEEKLSAELKALYWQKYQNQIARFDEKIEKHVTEREQLTAKQRELERQLEEVRDAQAECNEVLDKLQHEFYVLGVDVAKIEQQIQHIESQTKQWQLELDESQTLLAEIEKEHTEQAERAAQLKTEKAELAPKQDTIQQELAEAEARYNQAEEAMQQWRDRWEQFQSSASMTQQQVEVAKVQIQQNEGQLSRLQNQQDSLLTEQKSIDLTALLAALEPLRIKSAEEDTQLEQLNTKRSNLEGQIDQLRTAVRDRRQNLQQSRESLSEYTARQAALQRLQEASLNHSESQTTWLESSSLKDKQRLAQTLMIDAGWEKAAEMVLGMYLDAVCLDDASADLLEGAKAGVLTKTVGASAKPGSLAAVVRSDFLDAALLNSVYTAGSVKEALSQRTSLQAGESIITQNGSWIGKNWLVVAEENSSETSLLEREKELSQLDSAIAEQQKAVDELAAAVSTLEEQLQAAESEYRQHQQNAQAISQQHSQTQRELAGKESAFEQAQQRTQRIGNELADINAQITQLQNALNESQSSAASSQALQSDLEAERQTLLSSRDNHQAELNTSREAHQEVFQTASELTVKLSGIDNQLTLINQVLERHDRQVTQLTGRKAALESQLNENDTPSEGLHERLQALLEQRNAKEEEITTAKQRMSEHTHRNQQLQTDRDEMLDAINQQQQAIQQVELDRQSSVVNRDNILAEFEELALKPEDVLQTLSEAAALGQWKDDLDSVRRKIERLGPINLAAIDECKELAERKEYLDKQKADLEEALNILETAIAKIDKETKAKFRETYDVVNEHFKQLFPKIFGGGSAELQLMDDDLLSTGLMIRAQPPGKRNTTIHVLSGGEKALTAIALVFSLFQINPAPFCILDEVDAPLDDANVGRYCNLVREMSDRTQFLVISHNKVTIESADTLMGVTMQEAGVSRIVTVAVDEAIALTE